MTPEDKKRLEEIEVEFLSGVYGDDGGDLYAIRSMRWMTDKLRASWSDIERARAAIGTLHCGSYPTCETRKKITCRICEVKAELSAPSQGSGGV